MFLLVSSSSPRHFKVSFIKWHGDFLIVVLNPTDLDLQSLLAAQCHIGTKNVTERMKPYVYKARADGMLWAQRATR